MKIKNQLLKKNQIFGCWQILEDATSRVRVSCLCTKCNQTIKEVNPADLREAKTTSCGCHKNPSYVEIGKRFGFWQVIRRDMHDKWICICKKCNKTERGLTSRTLVLGKSKSCGCRNIESEHKGQIFGRWQVLGLDSKKTGFTICLCTKCNKTVQSIKTYSLIKGQTKSCKACNASKVDRIIGETYGSLTVVKKVEGRKVECKCKCGNLRQVDYIALQRGIIKSCGCIKRVTPQKKIPKIGEQIGNWTILKKICSEEYICRCSCGREENLKRTRIYKKKSCGCQRQQAATRACHEKFGGSYTSTPEFKEKRRNTMVKKYDVEYLLQSPQFYNKYKQTLLEKYNKTNPRQIKHFQEKAKQTCLTRYGVENPASCIEIKQKVKKTNQERYGVSNYAQLSSDRHRKSFELSTGEFATDVIKKYAVPNSTALKILKELGENSFYQYCENYTGRKLTALELGFHKLLDGEIFLERHNRQPEEFNQKNFRCKPDFVLINKGKRIYINTDGLYWHNECNQGRQDYHLNLQQEFEKHGLVIFQFRESELRDRSNIVKSIILNYLGIHEKKYHARKLTIKKLDYQETSKFFEENHLMGTTPSTGFGLYDDQELVSCLSIRWKSKEQKELEIARFASKINIAVRGGFSKLLKYVEKEYNPNSIISFCDMRYSTGVSYEKNGFENMGTTLGFEWTDFKNTYNRLKCKANMNKRRLTQKQQAEEFGWHKIYDAGQKKYRKVIL